MKKIYAGVLILLLTGGNVVNSFGATPLESLVMCVDSESTKEVFLRVQNGEGFKKSGQNFFVPEKPMNAFGFSVAYIGTAGVDMVPGPNITLKGKRDDVEMAVKRISGLRFKCGPGGCDHQVDKEMHVMVYEHPTNPDLTVVQCGALGQ